MIAASTIISTMNAGFMEPLGLCPEKKSERLIFASCSTMVTGIRTSICRSSDNYCGVSKKAWL